MALGLLIGFLVIIIVGLPVGFAMGVISIVSIGILDGSMLIIPQKLFSSINNFTYLCIPLYVLAAEIMSVGGLTEKIVHFCGLPGGAYSWRSVPCKCVGQYVFRRYFGFRDRGRQRPGTSGNRYAGKGRLSPRLCRLSDGGFRNHRPHHPPVHHHGHLRRVRQQTSRCPICFWAELCPASCWACLR